MVPPHRRGRLAAPGLEHPLNTLPDFDDRQPWGAFAPAGLHRLLLALSHRVPRALRRLVFALRRPIKYGVHQPLDVLIWGLRLRLLPRGNTSEVKLLFAPQLFDRDELQLLAQRLRPGSVFIDIGANVGAYSFWAHCCTGGAGRILAVEPDPEMRRRLQFNLDANRMADVTVCPVALSDQDGEGSLLVNPQQRGENTLVAAQASLAGGQRTVQKVRLQTLLALLNEHGVTQIDALKIDIEGHEPPVLTHFFQHAAPTLWPGVVITEYKRETAALIDALFVQRGYQRVLFNGLNQAYARGAPGAAP